MPRQPRYFLPGYAFHVVARGVNRQETFFEDEDYRLYLSVLRRASERHRCRIHAYVLMTNHVHLLVSPESRQAIPLVFQAIGRSYVQAINRKYERSGTLWEGRYRACLVDTDEYLLTCYRYVELNPVRAGLVADPALYTYSSYHQNASGSEDPLVSPHDAYLALGVDSEARRAAYRDLFVDVIDERTLATIRRSTNASRVLGTDAFRDEFEAQLAPYRASRPHA